MSFHAASLRMIDAMHEVKSEMESMHRVYMSSFAAWQSRKQVKSPHHFSLGQSVIDELAAKVK
jgi:hypothetical protein